MNLLKKIQQSKQIIGKNNLNLKIKREEFITAVNAEGALFYQGYSKPLYLQPMYQHQKLFKGGYPFAAKENDQCVKNYQQGICPIAEELHDSSFLGYEMCLHDLSNDDVNLILKAFNKVWDNLDELR